MLKPKNIDFSVGGVAIGTTTDVTQLIINSMVAQTAACINIKDSSGNSHVLIQPSTVAIQVEGASQEIKIKQNSNNSYLILHQDNTVGYLDETTGPTEIRNQGFQGISIYGARTLWIGESGVVNSARHGYINCPRANSGLSNVAGGNLTISPGIASGNANSGDIIFQGSLPVASGANPQTIIEMFRLQCSTGRMGVGVGSPSAVMHLKASTTTVASLLIDAGTLLSSPLSGVIENDGTKLYYTNSTPTRKEVTLLGNELGYNKTVYAAGTAYSLTDTSALVDFGTTDPSLVLDNAGTYLICARLKLDYNAATFVASRTATFKLRRINNTAADISNTTTTFLTDIVTTKTATAMEILIPQVVYTTANTDDVIQLWGNIDTVPSAGSIDVSEANIVAIKLY